ncbi:MAG: hypothetical protein D6773_11620 [Alphaproteobacteria bacterium]|nr:MAG: hypothetical protein D6773_11620 [Alphaproteobacteria bacterium]
MTPTKRILRTTIAGALATAVLLPQAAASASCLAPDEAAAEQVRRLQTTMMVGALQCRNNPELRITQRYNEFIKRYGGVITAHNRVLVRYFQRTQGGNYRSAMDRHVTSMANTISRAGINDRNFCDDVARLVDASIEGEGRDLVEIARWSSLTQTEVPVCRSASTDTVQAGDAPVN